MKQATREERLRQDLAAMESLRAESSILQFTAEGELPHQYRITFQGRIIVRESAQSEVCTRVGQQQCEIRLPYSYPRQPPDIRWTTPIFHPNISFSGFFQWSDAGTPWRSALTLDRVCERLWDIARLATYDPGAASNHAALRWLATPGASIPIDRRVLRNAANKKKPHFVGYPCKGARTSKQTLADVAILYIDENTPLPPSTRRDDILYIGFD